jgi:hypothetical protein
VIAGCSSGGSKSGSGKNGACALVARLDDIASGVARADVSDPSGFKRTLDTAVTQYATTVHDLRPLVPDDVREDLDRVEASVKQYRFEDALTDRVALDAYAQTSCGRSASSSSVSSPGASTTTIASS